MSAFVTFHLYVSLKYIFLWEELTLSSVPYRGLLTLNYANTPHPKPLTFSCPTLRLTPLCHTSITINPLSYATLNPLSCAHPKTLSYAHAKPHSYATPIITCYATHHTT